VRKLTLASCILSLLACAAPALAQGEAGAASGPIDVEFSLAVVSDYRFRGVSLSNGKVAVQPSFTITHESGIYGSVWGSNVADNGGDDVEIDVTLGYEKEFGDITANVGGVGYFYPGASGLNYGEILGSLSTSVGKGTVGVNIAYAPKQDNIGDEDNLYWGATGSMPVGESPVSLNASIGVEDGAFGDNKVDWSAGVDVELAGFTAGVKYIDTARAAGIAKSGAKAVFSLSKTF
jgi:uncharacterized protein (TIGR02001 family)